jgi:RNA polymerase sigma factor (sigma-70 family)
MVVNNSKRRILNKETKAERISNLLDKLVTLRRKCLKSKNVKLRQEFEQVQELCVIELDYLIRTHTRRYKSFSNYDDLCQDGRLALYNALQNYEPEKGNFYWWANKYIKTKISREANRHSTIKIPLKHTKYVTPYKVSQLPIIVDNSPSAIDNMERGELEITIRSAVNKLPDDQRRVIELHYEMSSGHYCESQSIGKICDILSITRVNCMKLLNEAKKSLRQELSNI